MKDSRYVRKRLAYFISVCYSVDNVNKNNVKRSEVIAVDSISPFICLGRDAPPNDDDAVATIWILNIFYLPRLYHEV